VKMLVCIVVGAVVGFGVGMVLLSPLFGFLAPTASAETTGWLGVWVGLVGGALAGAWLRKRW
jgi:hypothetical protein